MADTFLQRLAAWAVASPNKTLYTFLDDAGKPVASVTYKELDDRTRHLAALLRSTDKHGLGLSPGDRLLLVFLPSLDFIVSFIACLRAGVVAVPVYPPDPRKAKAHVGAFASIAASCGAAAVLTHPPYERIVSLAVLRESAGRLLGGLFGGSKRGGAADGAEGGAPAAAGAAWPDHLKWHSVDPLGKLPPLPAAALAALPPSAPALDGVAFLQYTSGSTAEPKGVMVSHANLAHNLATIVRALDAGPDTVVVSWLPQYHDMGLIGSYLGAGYCGGSGAYASPVSFIKRPTLWLEAASAWRATHLQSPNFGYALAARKWREAAAAAAAGGGKLPALDLSSVRHMFNAAEPVTAAAVADFLATFGAYGLRPAAMAPGYGLAEHTVYVSDGGSDVLTVDKAAYEADGAVTVLRVRPVAELGAGGDGAAHSSGTVDVVSCGRVTTLEDVAAAADAAAVGAAAAPPPTRNPDIVVAIVDAATRAPLPRLHTGEIWVASPSVAGGYWGKPQLSEEAFRATLAADDAAVAAAGKDATAAAGEPAARRRPPYRWLRTGDLGFLSNSGGIGGAQLFVSGRLKDLLIVRGRNYFPQDVEATVEAADARLRPGCTAAFQAWVPVATAAAGLSTAAAAAASSSTAAASGPGRPGEAVPAAAQLPAQGADGVVVVTELRETALPLTEADAKAAVAALRAAVMRDHGLAMSAVLLLKPHAARKTTSGKIARRWNQRAFTALTSPAAAPAGEPSPWALTGSQANVVHMWLAPAPVVAAADDEAGEAASEAPAAAADGTAGVVAATTAAATGAAAAPSTTRAPDRAQCLTLTGPALLAALTAEVATLLREPEPATIDAGAPLGDLGLDSLLLTQLAGLLQAEYGFTALKDEWLFAETTTLAWLAAHADGLRGQAPPPEVVMHARPGAAPMATAATAVVPADAAAKPAGTDAAAPAGAGAGDSGAPPGAGGVVEVVGLMTTRRASARPRQQPSWFQANCPCCMFCW